MHEAGVRGRLKGRLRASGGSTTLTLTRTQTRTRTPALPLNQVPTLVTVGADDLIVAHKRVRAAFGSWQVRDRARVGVLE